MCLKFPCIPVEIGVYWTSSQLLMCVCVCVNDVWILCVYACADIFKTGNQKPCIVE